MGGTPPPPLQTKFSAKRELRIWGVPPPPFTDKIRKVVFDVAPYMDQLYLVSSKQSSLQYAGLSLVSLQR